MKRHCCVCVCLLLLLLAVTKRCLLFCYCFTSMQNFLPASYFHFRSVCVRYIGKNVSLFHVSSVLSRDDTTNFIILICAMSEWKTYTSPRFIVIPSYNTINTPRKKTLWHKHNLRSVAMFSEQISLDYVYIHTTAIQSIPCAAITHCTLEKFLLCDCNNYIQLKL